MEGDGPAPDPDPRRELWRRGSYEVVGDWLAEASVSVLERVEATTGAAIDGRRVLDVATGTGTVAIEAARRGASVTAVDLTDELLEVAERRAREAGVDVRFVAADFDRLGDVFGDPGSHEGFDVITSAFGVIFAPDAATTLAGLGSRLDAGGVIGVSGWDPDGVFIVPDAMLDLLPERPTLPDMAAWTTELHSLGDLVGFEVLDARAAELVIPFASVPDAADQLERWSGGWAQLLEMFDGLGVGSEARNRFHDHLAAFTRVLGDGVGLSARYHVGVLRPNGDGA